VKGFESNISLCRIKMDDRGRSWTMIVHHKCIGGMGIAPAGRKDDTYSFFSESILYIRFRPVHKCVYTDSENHRPSVLRSVNGGC
jgi:hypothetical protein